MEDDCHPALEERLAAEATPHGLLVAVQLHAVLLEHAECGEGLRACFAREGAFLHQRIHLAERMSTDCYVHVDILVSEKQLCLF